MTEKNIKPISEEVWEITNQRYVGFIDIIGFQDLVARSTHNKIYGRMKKINDFQKQNARINWGLADSSKLVRTTTYSDSIMIYSCSESVNSLNAFICTIAGLIQDLLMDGIPFKGAVAFGTMTLDMERSIFFGQPLIDAYLVLPFGCKRPNMQLSSTPLALGFEVLF